MYKEELITLVRRHLPTHTTLYWSRRPGKFVMKLTGREVEGASFTGTVREWYETLVETLIDANNIAELGKKSGISVSPDVATILESTVLYKPTFLYDSEGEILRDADGSLLEHETLIGTLSNRFKVYKCLDQPRNKVLLFSLDHSKVAEVKIVDMDIL